jgi:hypothetical protein
MIVLVRDTGSEVRAHAGFADREHTRAIAAANVFRIASNTKTFVAAATMKLVEHGVLALDHPIAHMLPSRAERLLDRRYDLNAITIRMLLQHTSGIASHDADNDDGTSSPFLTAVKANPAHRWTATEQIAFSIEHFPPTHAPGAAMLYSDTGYVVLGQVIEHNTSRDLSPSYANAVDSTNSACEIPGGSLSNEYPLRHERALGSNSAMRIGKPSTAQSTSTEEADSFPPSPTSARGGGRSFTTRSSPVTASRRCSRH